MPLFITALIEASIVAISDLELTEIASQPTENATSAVTVINKRISRVESRTLLFGINKFKSNTPNGGDGVEVFSMDLFS